MMVGAGPPPRLTGEKALIVYDESTGMEHFIREIRVDAGAKDFGFVVPLPAQPEIAKAPSMFTELEDRFPALPPAAAVTGGGTLRGMKSATARAAPVEVIAQVQVGSFAATTLRATDTTALQQWLTANKFQADGAGREWLQHYVMRKAYFVAFKFNGSPSAGGGMKSESVRLSFKVARPYFPYFEPPSAHPQSGRQLAVCFVSQSEYSPRAFALSASGTRLTTPWRMTRVDKNANDKVRSTLSPVAALLPSEGLTIQVFLDTSVQRRGIGDILMVRNEPKAKDDDEALKALLPFWDPVLVAGSPVISEAP